jgi:hypothetical protein
MLRLNETSTHPIEIRSVVLYGQLELLPQGPKERKNNLHIPCCALL